MPIRLPVGGVTSSEEIPHRRAQNTFQASRDGHFTFYYFIPLPRLFYGVSRTLSPHELDSPVSGSCTFPSLSIFIPPPPFVGRDRQRLEWIKENQLETGSGGAAARFTAIDQQEEIRCT